MSAALLHVLVAAVVSTVSVGCASQPLLLTNPSFEAATTHGALLMGDVAPGWFVPPPARAYPHAKAVGGTMAHDGDRVLEVTVVAEAPSDVVMQALTLGPPSAAMVSLSVWTRVVENSGCPMVMDWGIAAAIERSNGTDGNPGKDVWSGQSTHALEHNGGAWQRHVVTFRLDQALMAESSASSGQWAWRIWFQFRRQQCGDTDSTAPAVVWIDDFGVLSAHSVYSGLIVPVKQDTTHRTCSVQVNRRVKLPSHTSSSSKSISACVVLTVDRLQSLAWQAGSWNGPMSVVLFANTEASAQRVLQMALENIPKLDRLAVIHLAWFSSLASSPSSILGCPFPTNTLRNVAVQEALTSKIIVVDVDLWSTENAHAKLSNHLRALQHNATTAKTAWVIPVFQLRHALSYPSNRSMIRDMLNQGTLEPYNFRTSRLSQHQTNAYRWAQLDYQVSYTDGYEPFVVLERGARGELLRDIVYDPSMNGSHKSRIFYTMRLVQQLHYQLSVVVSDVIFVHIRHTSGGSAVASTAASQDSSYFLAELFASTT